MRAIVYEAHANWRSVPIRSALTVMLFAVALLGVFAVSLSAAQGAVILQEQLIVAGSTVFILEGDSMDPVSCEALPSLDSAVVRSGSIANSGPPQDIGPGGAFSALTFNVTPGFVHLMSFRSRTSAGVLIGEALARKMQSFEQDHFSFVGEPVLIGSVSTSASRRLGSTTQLFIPTSPAHIEGQQCWIEFGIAISGQQTALSRVLLARLAGPSAVQRPLLAESDFERSPIQHLHDRRIGLIILGAVSLIPLAASLMILSRRKELALYRSVGLTSIDIALLGVVDTWLNLVAAFWVSLIVVTLLISAGLGTLSRPVVAVAASYSALVALSIMVVLPPLWLLAGSKSSLLSLKE